MTVQREEREPASEDIVWVICDGCGEKMILDADDPSNEAAISAAIGAMGWRRGKPETQRFNSEYDGKYREIYNHDLCGDCQSGELGPRPIFRHQPARPAARDAFDNDPCDEWPRRLVFAAVGLRPDCGHPRSGIPERCSFCAFGYPIGSVIPPWRNS